MGPMAKAYLRKLTFLLGRLRSERFKDIRLECRHFFSGAAVYADGRIFMSLTPVGLAIKLPETPRKQLMKEPGAKHLRYFPNAPVKKDYVVLPRTMLSDPKALKRWVKISIEHALSKP